MLRFELSKISDTMEKPVALGATITAEGQALVNDAVNGGVKPSTGAAGEQFVGIAMAQQLTMLALPKFDTVVADAQGKVNLTATPLNGTLLVKDGATTLVAGAPATVAGEYSISGGVITVHSSRIGKAIDVLYRYSPSTLQAKVIQGDIPPGGAAALLIGQVGVVTKGDVVTTEFDTTVDWASVSASAPVKLAANGLFTVGGSGAAVAGAYITQLPTAAAPFLGIHINA